MKKIIEHGKKSQPQLSDSSALLAAACSRLMLTSMSIFSIAMRNSGLPSAQSAEAPRIHMFVRERRNRCLMFISAVANLGKRPY